MRPGSGRLLFKEILRRNGAASRSTIVSLFAGNFKEKPRWNIKQKFRGWRLLKLTSKPFQLSGPKHSQKFYITAGANNTLPVFTQGA